jgi:aminodeoxyfutalosine synthase
MRFDQVTASLPAVERLFPSSQGFPPLKVDPFLVNDPKLLPVREKLRRGRRLDLNDGLALMTSTDLPGLGALAHQARVAKNGNHAFYVRNRHLNYTNICVNNCVFCAFHKEPDDENAFVLTPEQAGAKAAENPDMDIDEFHIVGGCHPDLDLDYYVELFQAVRRARPQAEIKAFTAVEVDHLAKISGLDVGEVLSLLKQKGMTAMAGGGAEVFSSRVRAQVCPRKISGARWLQVSGMAHSLGIPSNATMLYGHIETAQERVEHLLALRRQQDKTGGFSAFIPLAFHPQNTGLSQLSPTTGLDDLRVMAASRLLLDNFPHIKAYWVMLGPKLAQVALNFGADDLDGTIVEEHITHDAGGTTSQGMTEPELRAMIQAAGFQPVRRDCLHQPLDD